VSPPLVGGKYLRLSGSSMSAGVASGVVACVLEANRTALHPDGTRMAPLNPYAVKAILQYSATPLANSDTMSQGAGEINADGAIALTRALDTRTTPWGVAPLTLASAFGLEIDPWSQTLVAGSAKVANLTPGLAISGSHTSSGESNMSRG